MIVHQILNIQRIPNITAVTSCPAKMFLSSQTRKPRAGDVYTISSDCFGHPIGKQEIVSMAVAAAAHGGLLGA